MDAKEIIKKHFTIVRTIAVFFVLLLYFVVFNTENELLMLLAVLTILFMHKLLVFLVSHKVILYVLFKRFDASTFNEVISDRRFKVSWFYRINGAISSGDYQTTINIAVRQIKKRNLSINKKCLYLSILARAYFELRDFDKLKVLVAKYEEYRSKCISKKAITPQFFWWDYYARNKHATEFSMRKNIKTS